MKKVSTLIPLGFVAMASAYILKHSIGDSHVGEFLMGASFALMILGFLSNAGVLGKMQALKKNLIRAK